MSTSLSRLLTLQAVRNLTSLKRDAKRLQKKSQQVFGTEHSLAVCQQAMAVSRGFTSLASLDALSDRLGMNRRNPFWTLTGRSDAHQAVLDTLFRLDLDFADVGPLVFIGQQQHALRPALILLLERMSAMARPGLILIESTAAAIQDTALFKAATELELHETLMGFRALDLREHNLPVELADCALESRWRPWVVLFSRDDPVSEQRAGIVHSYFAARATDHGRLPILYVSENAGAYVPNAFRLEGHTAIVNGLADFPGGDVFAADDSYIHAVKVLSTEADLQFMGSKVPFARDGHVPALKR
nr:hypothetical protein [Pseudomonas savastanoi]